MDYLYYDDYMRDALGYSNMNYPNTCMNTQATYQGMYPSYDNLERMYPNTYRVVYPMVVLMCNRVTMPITESVLDRMTDDIYDRAKVDGRINIEDSLETENREDGSTRENFDEETRQRPRRNPFFRDMIRILLIRELLGRRPKFPIRPF